MAAPSVVGAADGAEHEDAGSEAETRNMLPEEPPGGASRSRKARERAEGTGSQARHFAKLTWLCCAGVLLGLLLVLGISIYSVSLVQEVRREVIRELHKVRSESSDNAKIALQLDKQRADALKDSIVAYEDKFLASVTERVAHTVQSPPPGVVPMVQSPPPGSGEAVLPMVNLFGTKPVADAIKARKSWFRKLADSLDKMSDSVPMSPSWQRYDFFGPVFHLCPNPLQSFGRGDQEKKVCDLATLTRLSSGTCEIMSLGSEGKWDFEREIFQRTPCRVHTFDCTGNYPAPFDLRSRVFSYQYCIGDERNGKQFKPYRELLALAHIKSAPTYFKIDVEGFEWSVFPAMFATDSSLLPDQIGFEIHYHKLMKQLDWKRGMKVPAEIAIFGETFYQAGYVPIDRRDNRYGVPGEATEFLMAKVL